ncbi:hypothetical protein ACTWP5_17390 [Streptomyces sp. 4N509B]|uniref:hypothetical protein n=1 Tax=Streptomyces sp. 4N509B TaxID=3457413 RepID=UPI003FD26557
MTSASDAAFTALCEEARRDPAVLGAVLSGSMARPGMATRWSDHDVYVVTADGATTGVAARRTPGLDVVVMPLAAFRAHGLPESGSDFDRYAFVHARILHDTPDGLLARLVEREATLGEEEAHAQAAGSLDAFVNAAYRALKNLRDGLATQGRLDAAEALPYLLAHAFARERRVRPFNRYLLWEVTRRPLADPPWPAEGLTALVEELLGPRWEPALRRVFATVERQARAAGHGPVLDAWGEDLRLLRGETAGHGDVGVDGRDGVDTYDGNP